MSSLAVIPANLPVIPAKAGIHLVQMPHASQLWVNGMVREMGPRFRGDDEVRATVA